MNDPLVTGPLMWSKYLKYVYLCTEPGLFFSADPVNQPVYFLFWGEEHLSVHSLAAGLVLVPWSSVRRLATNVCKAHFTTSFRSG